MKGLGGRNKVLVSQIMGVIKKLAKSKGKTVYHVFKTTKIPKSSVYNWDKNLQDMPMGDFDAVLVALEMDWGEASPIVQEYLRKKKGRK